MKLKFLVVIVGAFFFTGCSMESSSKVEDFKFNLSCEKYEVANDIYKENKEDKNFKKYADEFIDNDIKNKEKYLSRESYVEIEEDLDMISEFYNSNELIKAKEKIKEIKIELSLESKKLADKNLKLENELKELKERVVEQENLMSGVFEYKFYLMERWGATIEYPSFFDEIVVNEENGNVKITSNSHKATVFLEGWNIVDAKNIDQIFEEEVAKISDIPYKLKEENSYVVSWRENEFIYYKIAFVGQGAMNNFIIKYPENEKAFYGPILDSMYKTFKSGDLEKNH